MMLIISVYALTEAPVHCVYIIGSSNTHNPSSNTIFEATKVLFNWYLPGSWGMERSDVVCRPVFGGAWSWWNQRLTCPARGSTIRRNDSARKEAEIIILQLLCLLPLLWGSNCSHFHRLARRQQRLAMGFRGLYCNNTDVDSSLPHWLSLLQDKTSHRKPHHNLVEGKMSKKKKKTQYLLRFRHFNSLLSKTVK